MCFTEDIIKYINSSVLCWLATVSKDGIPNVSPKEIFSSYNNDSIIIANIASPQSLKNIAKNSNVCISFIDILVQKGYQLKGKGKIITNKNSNFGEMKLILEEMTQGLFPFDEIFKIKITSYKKIIAPKYILFPNTTEEAQIKSAINQYKL